MITNPKKGNEGGYCAFVPEICSPWGGRVMLWGSKMGGYIREIG